MEMRPFGRTDMRVSVLGFGGAEIGFERASRRDATLLLNEALDAGLNVFDTAECYLASEEMIGRAISHRRRDYHVFTKCGHPEIPGSEDWRPRSILASIRRSLQRLRTDRIDLIQLHSCSEDELRRGEAIGALERARAKGYVRYIGYSGDGSAARHAVESGAFDALQISASIADQEAIEGAIPRATGRGMGVIAKRPIANAAWRYAERPEDVHHRPYWERLGTLDYAFAKPGSDEAVSTALRFTATVPGVHTMIVGTAKPGRCRENAALLASGPLPPDRYEAIRSRWRAVAGPQWSGYN